MPDQQDASSSEDMAATGLTWSQQILRQCLPWCELKYHLLRGAFLESLSKWAFMFIPQSLSVILLFLISSKWFLQSEITLFTDLLEYRSPLTLEDTFPEPQWMPEAVDGIEP